jgi:mono/diheme cytochrome c family protein
MPKNSNLYRFGLPGAVAIIAAGGLAYWTWSGSGNDGAADPAERLALGRSLYGQHCASCHGVNLEGQPDWRKPLPNGRLPAPPHDASGHTWHHPDEILFRITKEGTAAIVEGGYQSDMPGFGGVLSDAEIRAVLAYIKSTWPEKLREHQASISRSE